MSRITMNMNKIKTNPIREYKTVDITEYTDGLIKVVDFSAFTIRTPNQPKTITMPITSLYLSLISAYPTKVFMVMAEQAKAKIIKVT